MDCEVVFMLQNKIAVVTGGTRGIGYAIVQKFLQNEKLIFHRLIPEQANRELQPSVWHLM